ncbi:MAG: efflux RND transporter periplasmic adaptor subunit [Gemmataceae bacterium]|nr:efflux RND transporter periplasmic adaptor subunit [Gemmataceae bacterium]MDW8264444.1 HlyD family efflux transporter periplasmic adaptor subunit [Gemmataceae bacterium]
MRRFLSIALLVGVLTVIGGGAWLARDVWQRWLALPTDSGEAEHECCADSERVALSPAARKNFRLIVAPVTPVTSYRQTIRVPGQVVDRPGMSDRLIAAPVAGLIQQIDVVPGDLVRPGARLCTIRLVSESIHTAQANLYRNVCDLRIAQEEKERLEEPYRRGVLPASRMIELTSQIRRLTAAVEVHRFELLSRGLSSQQVQEIAAGRFQTEMVVRVPAELEAVAAVGPGGEAVPHPLDVEELRVSLGERVEQGQVLCRLADHRTLWIEGRAFVHEVPLLQKAMRRRAPVRAVFRDPTAVAPLVIDQLTIRSVANVVDEDHQSVAFYVSLPNSVEDEADDERVVRRHRFRPGQRVMLDVAVDQLADNVFVLPPGAVVRDGAETYVFRQNGDLFERRPVHVVYEDREQVVVANDGSLAPGWFVVQNGAPALNRVLKYQLAGNGPSCDHHDH